MRLEEIALLQVTKTDGVDQAPTVLLNTGGRVLDSTETAPLFELAGDLEEAVTLTYPRTPASAPLNPTHIRLNGVDLPIRSLTQQNRTQFLAVLGGTA